MRACGSPDVAIAFRIGPEQILLPLDFCINAGRGTSSNTLAFSPIIMVKETLEPPMAQGEQKSRWEKIQEVIWDGPRSKEEKRLVQRLDLHLM